MHTFLVRVGVCVSTSIISSEYEFLTSMGPNRLSPLSSCLKRPPSQLAIHMVRRFPPNKRGHTVYGVDCLGRSTGYHRRYRRRRPLSLLSHCRRHRSSSCCCYHRFYRRRRPLSLPSHCRRHRSNSSCCCCCVYLHFYAPHARTAAVMFSWLVFSSQQYSLRDCWDLCCDHGLDYGHDKRCNNNYRPPSTNARTLSTVTNIVLREFLPIAIYTVFDC